MYIVYIKYIYSMCIYINTYIYIDIYRYTYIYIYIFFSQKELIKKFEQALDCFKCFLIS